MSTQSNSQNVRGDTEDGDDVQAELLNSMTQQEIDELKMMVNDGEHIYQRLVQSIAPTVYGA